MRWIFGDKSAADKAAKASEKTEWQHETTGVYLTDKRREAAHVARAEREAKLASDPAYIKTQQERVKAERVLKAKQQADQEAKQKDLDRQAAARLHLTEARYAEIQKQREVSKAKAIAEDNLKRQVYEAEVAKTHAELSKTKKSPMSFVIHHDREHVVEKNPNLASGGDCDKVLEVRRKMEEARRTAPVNGIMGMFKSKADPVATILKDSVSLRK